MAYVAVRVSILIPVRPVVIIFSLAKTATTETWTFWGNWDAAWEERERDIQYLLYAPVAMLDRSDYFGRLGVLVTPMDTRLLTGARQSLALVAYLHTLFEDTKGAEERGLLDCAYQQLNYAYRSYAANHMIGVTLFRS